MEGVDRVQSKNQEARGSHVCTGGGKKGTKFAKRNAHASNGGKGREVGAPGDASKRETRRDLRGAVHNV